MLKTPTSLRLQIGLFGRTNVGKSTFLNYITAQDVSITSSVAGTTTDVVRKSMELLPLGPVTFLDTAGIDDFSDLSEARLKKTKKVFDRADIFVLLTEPNMWGNYEEKITEEAVDRNTPLIVVINKSDIDVIADDFIEKVKDYTENIIVCSSIDKDDRDFVINKFKSQLIDICPDDFINPPALVGDLLPKGGLSVMIVPIDLEAPKGRLIYPQVQAIRDILDSNSSTVVVKEHQYPDLLRRFKFLPDLVICDSQVVFKMVEDTPEDIRCTTFSILFSRFKGNLIAAAKDVCTIEELEDNDKVLISESCSHHPIEDDIGRVKIPQWLRKYTKKDIQIDVSAGRDFPDNLRQYSLVIHCGGCMLTRREMLSRIQKAKQANIPITNYGVSISYLQGVLDRVLSPFPKALDAYRAEKNKRLKERRCLK
jgi:[FeFe] hydrogenase H-cluster maturation GTPase HydF